MEKQLRIVFCLLLHLIINCLFASYLTFYLRYFHICVQFFFNKIDIRNSLKYFLNDILPLRLYALQWADYRLVLYLAGGSTK